MYNMKVLNVSIGPESSAPPCCKARPFLRPWLRSLASQPLGNAQSRHELPLAVEGKLTLLCLTGFRSLTLITLSTAILRVLATPFGDCVSKPPVTSNLYIHSSLLVSFFAIRSIACLFCFWDGLALLWAMDTVQEDLRSELSLVLLANLPKVIVFVVTFLCEKCLLTHELH